MDVGLEYIHSHGDANIMIASHNIDSIKVTFLAAHFPQFISTPSLEWNRSTFPDQREKYFSDNFWACAISLLSHSVKLAILLTR